MLRNEGISQPSAVAAVVAAVLVTFSLVPPPARAETFKGPDVAGIDKGVNPGDDFFHYTNGAWITKTEIPPDRAVFGSFSIVDEEVRKRTSSLIQEAGTGAGAAEAGAGTAADRAKVGAYYQAYMDEKTIEARGLKPLQAELDRIRAISDRKGLARFLGEEMRADVDALNATDLFTDRPFGIWVAPDFSNPDRYVVYLLQGGLSMQDRDYYMNTGPKDVEIQAKYRAHVAAVLKLAKIAKTDDDAKARAERIYDLEKKIAATHGTRTDSMDVLKANNPWKTSEFGTKAPGLDWATYFEAAHLSGQPMMIVWHPGAATGEAALAGKEPLEVWKEYLAFHAIDRLSAVLPKAFADERFAFYGTVMTGATKQRDRWKRAVDATSGGVGDAVGRLYVSKYFPPEAKAEAQKMVANIVAAFRRRIDLLEWMTPATREKAKAKLDTLYVGIGYPEKWTDYSSLEIRKDDVLGNVQRAELLVLRESLAKLGKPVDKGEWCMTPQTVNAVNLPLQNALNFPAAILNPPFFDASADAAANYGAIGAVIGHEISHSFDDQGAQFDAQGRLANWWTPEDFAHFEAAGAKLVAQYNAYEPLPGLHVNGKLTLSENIADVAGLAAAFDGYRTANGGKSGPDAGGFTGDQRFFIAYGQAWRERVRPEALRDGIMTDGHSPAEFRADSVRNLDAWYSAFGIEPGRKLYLAPDARVKVW
jgi:predicted metalloendopeptidase